MTSETKFHRTPLGGFLFGAAIVLACILIMGGI